MTIDRKPPLSALPNGFLALIVDNDPASRLTLRGLIEKEGGRVIDVEHGTAALTVLSEHQPDIILLDAGSAEADGFDTCSLIRALPHGLNTPLLMITALDNEASVKLIMAAGAADYITRPICAPVLRQRMLRLMQIYRTDEAIVRAKKEWEATFDAVSDLVILTDLNGKITRCNSATIERLRTTYSQLIGRDLKDVLLKDSDQELMLPSGKPREMQIPSLSAWFEIRSFPAHLDGHRYATIHIFKDITERRQLEENVSQSEQRFKTLIETIPEGIQLIDANGRTRYSSPTSLRITGYSPEDTGFNAFGYLHPDDLPRTLELFAQIGQESHSTVTTELRIRHKSGQWLWVEFTARNLLSEPGVNAILVNFRDITSRKELQERLRRSEQRFRALTEKISDGIMLYDAQGKILYLSPTVTRLTGYGEEIIGQNAFMFGHPEDILHARDIFMQLMEHPGKSVTDEFHLQHKDGSYIWIESTLRNMLAEPGMNAILVNFNDITERKQSEVKLRQLSQAVEQSPVSIVITNPSGNIEYVNPRFTQLTGYTAEEVMGGNPRLLQSGETPVETYTELWATITSGHEWRGEFINRKKSGEIFVEQASVSPVMDSNRIITHFLALKEDITERKRAEQALHASEARFRTLFEDSPVALWEEDFSEVKFFLDRLRTQENVTDFRAYFETHPDTVAACAAKVRVNDVNKATLKMLGAQRKEQLFGSLDHIVSTKDNHLFRDELIAIAGGCTNCTFEGLNHTLNGETRYVSIVWSVWPGYEDTLSKVTVSVVDLTERKRAEELLKETEERLRLIVETVPIPILISAVADGEILFANPSFGQIVDMTMEELVGHKTPIFI